MKAMVLAAGLGTRLKPLTESKPKALVEVDGRPLIEAVLKRLISFGVSEAIINLHHFPDQIIGFLHRNNNFGVRIDFSMEEPLLETGGGLKKAADFFDDDQPFILHNVDIISDIDLGAIVTQHVAKNALATLAVNQRKSTRYFIFDERDLLCGWKSVKDGKTIVTHTAEGQTTERAFCGIHVISPALLGKMTESGAFSIVDSYLRLAGEGERIVAFRADDYAYQDFGKIEQFR
jgi:NDP-sugar pyrophosphorylase family protein